MTRRWDGLELVLLLVGLVPAMLAAHWWPHSPLALLPYAAWALYAAWWLGLSCGLRRGRAFVAAGAVAVLLSVVAGRTSADCAAALWLVAGLVMALSAWRMQVRHGRSFADLTARASLRTLLPIALSALGMTILLVPMGRWLEADAGPAPAATTEPAARPDIFIPLSMDPHGKRALLFSLRDEGDDHEHYSLWTLNANDGAVARVYRGYPYLTCDWCPGGNQITFPASDNRWDEQDAPFGIYAAGWNGEHVRRRLPPPTDGSTWLYPLWSRQDDLLAAWLLPTGMTAAGPTLDVPESYIVPADTGEAHKVHVPGCRLAMAGAWQADGTGLYTITERGIYLVPQKGKAKRIVPAGEAPLDPFPMAVPEGVRPTGDGLAYLELTFKDNGIERMDLGLADLRGRRHRVLGNIYPLGFAWSHDGHLLVAIEANKHDELIAHLYDADSHQRRKVATGLKLVSRELPIRTMFAPDDRHLLIEGQITPEDIWGVSVMDVASGKVAMLDAANGQLSIGWRADNKILVSDTGSVTVISLDGRAQPIYPHRGDEPAGARVRSAALRVVVGDPLERLATLCHTAAIASRK